MRRHFIITILSALSVTGCAQDFYQSISVRIEPDPNNIGAGCVLGSFHDSTYIITAKHVVDTLQMYNGRQRKVHFKDGSTSMDYDIHYLDEHIDFAIIRVPGNHRRSQPTPLFDLDLHPNDSLKMVSCRENWITLPPPPETCSIYFCCADDATAEMALDGVFEGNSGSIVYSKDGIAGLVVRNTEMVVYVLPSVAFYFIIQQLELNSN